MYASEATTHSHHHTLPSTQPSQTVGSGSRPSPVLPEDLGSQAASLLIEEIVKVINEHSN